jgi:acyl-CoA synthetase (AMP-forming)/AMP-acid ligase II
MAARAIAVPMSPAFPDPELRYILNQSEAALLVSSPRFAAKAKQVLAADLAAPLAHLELPKHQGGRDAAADQISWSEQGPGNAGMMLYTSGTTNRPVWMPLPVEFPSVLRPGTDMLSERCITAAVRLNGPVPFSH